MIQLKISLAMPPRQTPEQEKARKKECTIEQDVRDALEKIDSGFDSHVEWLMIRGLYKRLSAIGKPSKKAKNLMEMIEPVLAKYGYYESGSKKGNK